MKCVHHVARAGLSARLAGRSIGDREVSQKICGGGYKRLRKRLALVGFEPLISAEEKQFVGDDPAPKRASVLVLVERVLGRGKEVGCIDEVVADELKSCAVPLIGSRTGDDIDQAIAAVNVNASPVPVYMNVPWRCSRSQTERAPRASRLKNASTAKTLQPPTMSQYPPPQEHMMLTPVTAKRFPGI